MSLYERIVSGGAGPKISVHRLYAAMVEHLRGELTAAQVKTAFNFSPQEGAELQTIIDALNAKPTLVDKLVYAEAIHAVFLLVEDGDYTEAKAKSSSGF